ncbi:MAG: hypothetical protein VX699_02345, partial [Myxococcota bacterium]|nr:hypothetical protein [Myxococcota bacterium]
MLKNDRPGAPCAPQKPLASVEVCPEPPQTAPLPPQSAPQAAPKSALPPLSCDLPQSCARPAPKPPGHLTSHQGTTLAPKNEVLNEINATLQQIQAALPSLKSDEARAPLVKRYEQLKTTLHQWECFTGRGGCAWDQLPADFALHSPARIEERLLHQAKALLDACSNGASPKDPIDGLFDYVDAETPLSPNVERSYWKGILRGTNFQPVFAVEDGRLSPKIAHHANRLVELLAEKGRTLVHTHLKGEASVPLTASDTTNATLGFVAGARKIREKDIPSTDPRRLAIEKYRQRYPGGVPVWLEGSLGTKLALATNHSLPLGGGAMANFGFAANGKTTFNFQRLAYFSNPTQNGLAQSKTQLKRLSLTPLLPSNFKHMEDGASFKIRGEANLRVDAALGLGATIPALENIAPLRELTRVGAAVEVGTVVSLAGAMEAEVIHQGAGKVTLNLGNDQAAKAGLQLKAFAGVNVSQEALQGL